MVRLVDDLFTSRAHSRHVRASQSDLTWQRRVNAVETSRPLIEVAGHVLTITLPSKPTLLKATRRGSQGPCQSSQQFRK